MEQAYPKNRHLLRNMTLGAVAILILAQMVTFILALSSFENTYRASLISRYQFLGGEMRKKIETSVNFGKPFHKYAGMDLLFEEFMAKDPDITGFFVTDPQGMVFYSTRPEAQGHKVPIEERMPVFKQNDEVSALQVQVIEQEESAYLVFPVYYNQQTWAGKIYLQFSKRTIAAAVKTMIVSNLRYFIPLLLFSVLAAWFFLYRLIKSPREHRSFFSKKFSKQTASYVIVLAVLLLSQVAYTALNVSYFRKSYVSLINQNLHGFSGVVRENFQYYLDLGLKIQRLKKAEHLLLDRVRSIPECDKMVVLDMENRVLYSADQDQKTESILESAIPRRISAETRKEQEMIEAPLVSQGQVQGFLLLKPNRDLIDEKAFNIFLDALTVVVIAMVFSFQLMALFSLMFQKKSGIETVANPIEEEGRSMKIIRLASFIFFFGESIPLSFLPLYIQKLYLENPITFLGFSQETLLSIPISTFMFGVSIFVLATGSLSRKLSSRRVFLLCVPMIVAGSLLSAMATDIVQLAIFRFISGLGYGGAIITGISLVVENTHSGNRTAGFGYWSAGYAAAFICATAMGGVVAERLGFRAGMLVSTLFGAFFGLFVFFFVKNREVKKTQPVLGETEKTKITFKDFFSIFKNQSLIAALLFASVPVQIAFIGVFQYSFPLYMGTMGVSPSNIGRILTIYALISLLTPYIGRLADKYRNEKIFIIIGNLITGLSLLLFMFSQDMMMLIFVIMAIGIGGMFVDATEEAYITSSEEAQRMGEAKLLSIYTTYEKVAAILVPLIAGTLINTLGYSHSIAFMGGLILVGVLFFALLSRNLRRLSHHKNPAGEDAP